jgi:hypothetical protein
MEAITEELSLSNKDNQKRNGVLILCLNSI